MIRLLGPGARLCDGMRRREVLRIGGLGVLGAGLNLPDLTHAADSPRGGGPARSGRLVPRRRRATDEPMLG